MTLLDDLKADMEAMADRKRAKDGQWFFKTGKGEYGEGDVFMGIRVPEQRKVAKKYRDMPLEDIERLLGSHIHEHRLTAAIMLVQKFELARKARERDRPRKGDPVDPAGEMRAIYELYLNNTEHINNWDIVDSSAPQIVGGYLLDGDKDTTLLDTLARSESLWERRIAMMATFQFIKVDRFEEAFRLATVLLHDGHDLIHKAVGWMLREVGNRDREAECSFLDLHAGTMPRTMLRYAIEKFPTDLRKHYMTMKDG